MNTKRFFISTILFILVLSLFVKCNKDNTVIGADLISDSDRIKITQTDTVSVSAYSYFVDTLRTDNVRYVTLGTYLDPVFGRTTASFVSQILISNSKSFNDSVTAEGITVDSLLLYFKYPNNLTRVYGHNGLNCKVDVKKINKFLDYKESFYANYQTSELNAEQVHSFSFNPKQIIDAAELKAEEEWQALIDTALANNEDTSIIKKVEPLAIVSTKLPNSVRDEVYSALVQSVRENGTFVELFNGFYITPSPDASSNAINIFEYASPRTEAILYYHKDDKPEDIKNYHFLFNQFATHFNVFEHNYTEGNILANVNQTNTQLDTVVYLQGIGGLSTKIKFPYIEKLRAEGRWAVSKAELVMTVPKNAEIAENIYPAPEELMLYRIDENNKIYSLREFAKEQAYFGEKYTDNQYIFDITLYMQLLLKGEYKNDQLLLRVRNSSINPARVVIGANNHSQAIKLRLIASKL